jgi:hypothetical protein
MKDEFRSDKISYFFSTRDQTDRAIQESRVCRRTSNANEFDRWTRSTKDDLSLQQCRKNMAHG